MKIDLHEITVRDVTDGYVDSAEEGVVGYGGMLNIRPQYQREFVYDAEKRNAVMDTIKKNFPLNVFYWIKNDEGNYEMLDGQQRTISFCQYVHNVFSLDNRYFHNLTEPEREQIFNYKLMIYLCEGDEKEKLDWFKIINIAGVKLTDQEMRNAIYTGPWLSDAKVKFSKTGCAAYGLAKDYVTGSPIRQEFLETAIKWISKGQIEDYMSRRQHDPNAKELWTYFRNVIEWAKQTFPSYRREMKGQNWGALYDEFGERRIDTNALEQEVEKLMMDDDVTSKKGIYPYVLNRDQNLLSIRKFSESQKRSVYEQQAGICKMCGEHFKYSKMEADHITPWSKGGKTNIENCQLLCQPCNRRKSNV